MTSRRIHSKSSRTAEPQPLPIPSSPLGSSDAADPSPSPSGIKSTPRWLALAIGSGAFAAFNGVFAKLTTTAQTHGLASLISHTLGFGTDNWMVEGVVRGLFFGLNLLSNAIMWILFTRALTASTSTTRVAVMNTSANFLVTAILGMVVFSEKLPMAWWMGAALLVAGSVIIGARENKDQKSVRVDAATGLGAGDVNSIDLGSDSVSQSVLAEGKRTDKVEVEK